MHHQSITKEEVIKFLKNYQAWRLGQHDNQPDPKEVTQYINRTIQILSASTSATS